MNPDQARWWAALALGALLVGTGAAGCSQGGGSSERSLVELRPVLDAGPPPCTTKRPKSGKVAPLTRDGKVECLTLGPPIVDANDVRSATVDQTPSSEPALSIVLGQVGSANLDNFGQSHAGKRLALLADGNVMSAPVISAASYAGRLQVTGLSKEKTAELFRRLNKLIRPG